jgi:gentisate 1,2-dioxygenase
MGLNRTVTGLTHYDIQMRRRKAKLEQARENVKYIVRREDVEMHPTERGFRSGCYIGIDGDRPSKLIDCYVHEIDPGVTSTIHRHSWDAAMVCLEGRGWLEVDGVRYDYKPWDTLYIPMWAWHRQGNDGTKTARFLTIGVEPTTSLIGMSFLDDRGHTPFAELPPPPPHVAGSQGADPYARRKRRLADFRNEYVGGRIHAAYEDLTLLVNPKGTRSTFMCDEYIGNKTSGLTVAMNQIAPGKYQKKHRHGGEAYLYAIEGRGHSVIDGQRIDWSEGDLVVIDHFAWHQHFNSDPELTARLVRVHTTAGIMDAFRGLLDPLVLSEEEPGTEPDVTHVVWPPDRRPE